MAAESALEEYFAAINAHSIERVGQYLADALRFETPIGVLSKPQVLGLFSALFTGLPDLRFEHGPMRPDGDTITTEVRVSGTHTGKLDLSFMPFMRIPPVPPTGRRVQLPPQDLTYTMRDDRIERIVTTPGPGAGLPGMLEQLGVDLREGPGSQ